MTDHPTRTEVDEREATIEECAKIAANADELFPADKALLRANAKAFGKTIADAILALSKAPAPQRSGGLAGAIDTGIDAIVEARSNSGVLCASDAVRASCEELIAALEGLRPLPLVLDGMAKGIIAKARAALSPEKAEGDQPLTLAGLVAILERVKGRPMAFPPDVIDALIAAASEGGKR